MTSDDDGITPRRLVVAAVALLVLGVVLLWPFGDDDSPADVSADDSASAEPEHSDPPPDDSLDDPSTDDDASNGDETTSPAPLPPGMTRPGPTPAPPVGSVDAQSDSAVAVAALTAMYSMDSATDDSAEEALERCSPWLAHDVDDDAYDLDDLETFADDLWGEWSDHQAYTSVNEISAVAVGHQEHSDHDHEATQTVQKWTVAFTPLGRDGWNGLAETHSWFVSLERSSANDPWKITEMRNPSPVSTPTGIPTDLPTSSPTES